MAGFGATPQQPPQGWMIPSRLWLFWLGSFMHRWTAVVVNVRGRARMFGFGPTIFFFASSSASSNVARVLSPMPRAMPGSLRTDDVDGAGVHLRDVSAGHHGEAVERVERIGRSDTCGCIPRSSRNTRRSGSCPAGSACSHAGTCRTARADTASVRRGNSRRRCWTR